MNMIPHWKWFHLIIQMALAIAICGWVTALLVWAFTT